MALRPAVPAWHLEKKVVVSVSVAICLVHGLLGSFPSVFFQNSAVGVSRPAPSSAIRTASRDLFAQGPMELKVLYEPRYMELDDSFLKGLRTLEERTNTRVRLSRQNDWSPEHDDTIKFVSIAGSKSNVLEALSHFASNLAAHMPITFLVPPSFESALRASTVARISEVEEKTSARIFVRTLPYCGSKVSIRGSHEALTAAAEWLLTSSGSAVQDASNELTSGQSPIESFDTEIFFKLSEQQAKDMIGEEGDTIERISNEWMVGISVDRENRMLKLSGRVGDVHAAHRYIMETFVVPTTRR